MLDPIEVPLDDVLLRLRAFDRRDRRWLCEALLDNTNCVYGIGSADDPLGAVSDVGEGFVQTVALAVRRQPERTCDVYQAAHGVLVGLLEVVRTEDSTPEGPACGYDRLSPAG